MDPKDFLIQSSLKGCHAILHPQQVEGVPGEPDKARSRGIGLKIVEGDARAAGTRPACS